MLKLIFELDIVDGWPPVAAESLWLEKEGEGFRVKTFPYFIRNIAYDDLIEVKQLDDVRGEIRRVIERSSNSTVWAFIRKIADEKEILARLAAAGIGYSGGAFQGYYSINLPSTVSMSTFDQLMRDAEEHGRIALVYGALRHSDR